MRRWLPLFVFFSVLILYLRTLVPGIYVSDFVEFQYQPWLLGLPHPNGFPFYMLLGWLWSHIPVGDIAWRMNALSAVGGALAAAATATFAQRLSRRTSVGLLAGGLLALSPTLWFYSLAAERYTINIALLAGTFWSAWEASRRLLHSQATEAAAAQADPRVAARLAYLSALLLGLSLAIHPSAALIAPFWLVYLFWRLPALRRSLGFWVKLALVTAAPLLLYVYVPWRWQAFSDLPLIAGIGRSSAVYQGLVHVWYEPTLTPGLLYQYVVGLGGYVSRFILGGWLNALRDRWLLQPSWDNNIAPILLVLAGLGMLRLLRRDAVMAFVMAGSAITVALITAYITQGKYDAYLLPAFWVTFFFASFSLDLLLAGIQNLSARIAAPALALALDRVASVTVVGLLLVLLTQRYSGLDLSRWADTRNDWEVTLAHPLDDQAALLAHWSDLTPLWYMQHIDGRRQDLLGLFPPDPAAVIQPWLEQGKALYLAAPLNEYAPDLGERYHLAPWGKLVRILPLGQEAACPIQGQAGDAPAAWPFAITSWEMDPALSSDTPGILRFCWQARGEVPPDTFLSLRLREPAGEEVLNVNQPLLPAWLPKRAIPAGDTGMAVVSVRLPLGTPPDQYAVELMPYRLLEDGAIEHWAGVEPVSLGRVTVAPAIEFRRNALTDETAPIIPLRAGPLSLRAWRVSDLPVRPGDPVQIEFLWELREALQAEAPLSLSIGFRSLPSGRLADSPRSVPLKLPAAAQPGALVRTVHSVATPRGTGDHVYWVEPRVQLGERLFSWAPTGRLLVDTIQVVDRPHLDGLPAGALPLEASFGEFADLRGYELKPASPRPGEELALTLYWQSQLETDRSYAVFVHLLDAQGHIVSQHDGLPADGTLPTNIWATGEFIADTHRLPLSADLPSGAYTLHVGLNDPSTGARVPVVSGLPVQDDAAEVLRLTIGP